MYPIEHISIKHLTLRVQEYFMVIKPFPLCEYTPYLYFKLNHLPKFLICQSVKPFHPLEKRIILIFFIEMEFLVIDFFLIFSLFVSKLLLQVSYLSGLLFQICHLPKSIISLDLAMFTIEFTKYIRTVFRQITCPIFYFLNILYFLIFSSLNFLRILSS